MNKLRNIKIMKLLGISLLYILFSANTSYAYIDPGSGSMVLQVLIASILGVLTAVKIYWSKLKNFFSRNSDTNTNEESER